MAFAIRPFITADLPELLDLWVASWSEVYAEIDFQERRPWFADHIADWCNGGGACRVLEETSTHRIVGFILINTGTALLDQICVGTAWKGKDAARFLLAEAKRLSPRMVRLDVNAMNHRAIAFYSREGFEKTGEGVNPRSGLPIFHYRWQP